MIAEELVDRAGVVVLERATLADVDFRKAAFQHIAPSACLFVNCDFSGLTFDSRLAALFASRRQSVFRDCRFDGADLRKTGPGQSRFERCSFKDAVLDGWTSLGGEFVECTFSGTLRRAKFHGRPHGALAGALTPARSINEFRGNDLTQAVLVDSAFIHGIPLGEQRWPEGGEVRLDHIQQRLERARLEIMRWKDPDSRGPAVEVVMRVGSIYGEQVELMKAQYDGSTAATAADLRARVWELIARPL